MKLDLLSVEGRTVLWDVLSSGQILYVHMAPPCSTASAARFIPGGPRPLRDVQNPDGLGDLSFLHRCQVRNANKLYALCRDVALFCHSRGIGWSLENPSSSLFWMTSPMVHLARELGSALCTVVFDHCCWEVIGPSAPLCGAICLVWRRLSPFAHRLLVTPIRSGAAYLMGPGALRLRQLTQFHFASFGPSYSGPGGMMCLWLVAAGPM